MTNNNLTLEIDVEAAIGRMAIIEVHATAWTGIKASRVLAERLARDIGAKKGSIKVGVNVADFHPLPGALKALAEGARREVARQSFGWRVDAQYLLAGAAIPRIQEFLAPIEPEFRAMVDRLVGPEYEDVRRAAEAALGPTAWAEARFPSREELRSKYSFDYSFHGLSASPPLDALPRHVAEVVQRRTEETIRQSVRASVQDVLGRLEKAVANMSTRLRDDRVTKNGEIRASGFHETLVTNIADVAGLLADFNPLADPALEGLGRRAIADLCAADTAALKQDPILRADTARKADDILADLRSIGLAA